MDGDTYLHQEEDPRYRGAAIPSRAFRYLQNMTDSGDVSNSNMSRFSRKNNIAFIIMQLNYLTDLLLTINLISTAAPRAVNTPAKKQNRNSNTFGK